MSQQNEWWVEQGGWLIRVVVLSMMIAMGWSNLNSRLAVVETRLADAKEDVEEIKEGIRDTNRKLDELKDLLVKTYSR